MGGPPNQTPSWNPLSFDGTGEISSGEDRCGSPCTGLERAGRMASARAVAGDKIKGRHPSRWRQLSGIYSTVYCEEEGGIRESSATKMVESMNAVADPWIALC